MTPVNNKSMLAFLFSQMEKLDKKEITTDEAKAQASLAKQVNNSMRYELDLATTKMKLREFNKTNDTDIEIRNIESKNFD